MKFSFNISFFILTGLMDLSMQTVKNKSVDRVFMAKQCL